MQHRSQNGENVRNQPEVLSLKGIQVNLPPQQGSQGTQDGSLRSLGQVRSRFNSKQQLKLTSLKSMNPEEEEEDVKSFTAFFMVPLVSLLMNSSKKNPRFLRLMMLSITLIHYALFMNLVIYFAFSNSILSDYFDIIAIISTLFTCFMNYFMGGLFYFIFKPDLNKTKKTRFFKNMYVYLLYFVIVAIHLILQP